MHLRVQEDDVDVIQARIAERLLVSRPAVSEMMRRLEHEGLISTDGGIRLTPAGLVLAERVVRRHRLAERFLTDVLELSWAEAHHEAGKWEHVMSTNVEQAMDRLLGSPTTCPHGNPIPGSDYIEPDGDGALEHRRRPSVHDQPDPRGARVHAGPARVPRGVRARTRHERHGHRDLARRHTDPRDRRPPHRRRSVRQRPHPRQRVSRRRPWALAALSVAARARFGACRTTIDPTVTTLPPGSTTSTTAFVAEGSTSELLASSSPRPPGSARRSSRTRVTRNSSPASTRCGMPRGPVSRTAAPDLLIEFDRAIAMMDSAVVRRRHADADKALNNLRNLIAARPAGRLTTTRRSRTRVR